MKDIIELLRMKNPVRLLTSLIFAGIWGGLVYSLHHSIGHEKATGYPSVSEDLLWAGIARSLG